MQGSSINDSVSQASFINCFCLDFLDLNHLQFSYRGVSVVHAAPFSPQNMFLLPIYSNLFLDNRSSARLDASGGTPSGLLFDDNATHLTGIKNKLVARWFHTVSVLFVLIKVVIRRKIYKCSFCKCMCLCFRMSLHYRRKKLNLPWSANN